MKESVKLGIIYGLLSVATLLLYMMIDINLLFSGWSMLLSLAISLGVLVIGGRMLLRKRDDIDLGYGSAVKYLFVAAVIGFVISSVVSVPIFNNNEKVKTGFVQYQKSVMESSITMVTKLGGDENQAREAIEQIEEQIASGELDLMDGYPYTWSKLPLTLGMSAIFALIYALIAAIFVRVKYN